MRRETVAADRVAALRRLIADVVGADEGAEVPFAAPLLLFAHLDVARRGALYSVAAGTVLVQEHLAIGRRGPMPVDEPIEVRTKVRAPASAAAPMLIEADLVDRAGAVVVGLRAALRAVEASSLAASKGLPASRTASAGPTARRATAPLTAELVARWTRLVGDDNPIHVDPARAAALGLAGAVVPGALFAAIAEAFAQSVAPGAVTRLNLRFVAPVVVGHPVAVEIHVRPGEAEAGRRDLRLVFVDGDRVAAIADLTVV
ncbi:MAG: MaoC family dehydratase [Phyllobacteriaceae bacterium]|nr:MaoC family dehydratase [Phyllobacteriaceae bacterium]